MSPSSHDEEVLVRIARRPAQPSSSVQQLPEVPSGIVGSERQRPGRTEALREEEFAAFRYVELDGSVLKRLLANPSFLIQSSEPISSSPHK